ncbi:hypothetical protein C2G38_2236359 [Gigaspora rosea]|uniref:Uncharacterized protein n=1 Tax=Gigaspora rosea TaxID=44941 RepID=A0A397TTD7_9GLOM|nr:hypothetical protein C2G38_2236359 [Gigaspora rosea]
MCIDAGEIEWLVKSALFFCKISNNLFSHRFWQGEEIDQNSWNVFQFDINNDVQHAAAKLNDDDHAAAELDDDDVQHAAAELDDDDDVQNAVAELDNMILVKKAQDYLRAEK